MFLFITVDEYLEGVLVLDDELLETLVDEFGLEVPLLEYSVLLEFLDPVLVTRDTAELAPVSNCPS